MPWRGLSRPPAEPVVKPYGCDLRSAGYQMVTISELAHYRGGMLAGKVYSQFQK